MCSCSKSHASSLSLQEPSARKDATTAFLNGLRTSTATDSTGLNNLNKSMKQRVRPNMQLRHHRKRLTIRLLTIVHQCGQHTTVLAAGAGAGPRPAAGQPSRCQGSKQQGSKGAAAVAAQQSVHCATC